jgi:hypothetical protein
LIFGDRPMQAIDLNDKEDLSFIVAHFLHVVLGGDEFSCST